MKQNITRFPILLLTTMGLCLLARAQGPESSPEDNVVEQKLGSIETGNKRQRKEAMRELAEQLKQKRGASGLSSAKRDKLVKSLMKAYRQEQGKDADAEEIRLQAAELITTRGRSSEAKAALDEIMESGDTRVKTRVMQWLGHPDGVSGDDLVDKINRWSEKGLIPKRARFGLMGKVSKQRAIPEILKAVDATTDREELTYAAWALQDIGSRSDMARAFKKTRELGLHKKASGESHPMYWVDKKKFAEYVNGARGEDLKVALELMEGSSTMRPPEVLPALISGLNDANAEVRRLAVKRLEEATDNYRIDYEATRRAIESRLAIENDPALKKDLAHCLKILGRRQERAKAFLQKEKDWVKKNSK